MTQTIARITKSGKHFEILVDLESAMKFKKGETDFIEFDYDKIFTNAKKGELASSSEIEIAFGTSDFNEVAKKIIKQGEVLLTQDYRDEEKEKKYKQVIDFLSKNAIDPQTKNPITPERIKSALNQSGINIKNTSIANQLDDILNSLNKIMPIKIETKKIKVIIPSMYTAKVYGIITPYKEKENWKDDGSLEVLLNIPAGLIMDFYDKLNSATSGSALTEEINQDEA